MASIVIGADLCPIERNQQFFRKGDARSLFHDLLPEFEAASLVVANLECPLVETASPIRKTGPTFGAPSDCINGVVAGGIDVLCLANNHILDHGGAALANTLRVCRDAGIATVGAGENLESAGRILIRDCAGVRVGIIAMAEHEFSIATATSHGANPLNLIQFVRAVRDSRSEFDFLIVLVHGGHEFHAPSPRVQDTCRFLVEMGAGCVIVQHPHILGGYERYRDGFIFYGQGALVMDEGIYRNLASFHEGYLVKLFLSSTKPAAFELIPFVQSTSGTGAQRLLGADEKRFFQKLARRAEAILDPRFVADEWRAFCEQRRHGCLSSLLGHGRVLYRLNRRGWIERLFYREHALRATRNMVFCETHREMLETLLSSPG